MEHFDDDEIEAVRWCFGRRLPEPAVEAILEARIRRVEDVNGVGVRYVAIYKDGNQHGTWETWYKSGQKWSERHYMNGKLHGKKILWYTNGQKSHERHFVDDRAHGRWTVWDSSGQQTCEEHIHDERVE